MAAKKKDGSLTAEEKRIVKALLQQGQRNQDIQALINVGRKATVNSARITEVKKNQSQKAATEDEVAAFQAFKLAFDHTLGINPFENERLFRSREAMMMAVHVFNSPVIKFKTELFAVLANIAWTYLLHEFYERRGVSILREDGKSVALSHLLSRPDCPLSKGVRRNLDDLKLIRDSAEHMTLGRGDIRWASLFQACCLNFEAAITKHFGGQLSLARELSFALQFAKLDIHQISELHRHDIPAHIEALDARMMGALSDEDTSDTEYRFRVIYTLDSASKGKAHIHFVSPETVEGAQVRNVLVKYKSAGDLYPHKPGKVVEMVRKQSKKPFTSHNHTQAWRKFKVRPLTGSAQPDATKKDYCIFHPAHRDYTYSDAWVEFLVEQIATEAGMKAITSFQL